MSFLSLYILLIFRVQSDAVQAVEGLLSRLFGDKASAFVVRTVTSKDEEFFTLSGENGKIVIEGTSGTSCAVGVKHYLEKVLNTTYEWQYYDISVPDTLPLPSASITKKRVVKWSYYENVCTVSYTQAFWKWPEWEKHLDWMALQGINLPLAFTGQEYAWLKTFQKFGFELEDLRDFFSGPAFFAWNRMGNMQGWGNFGNVLSEANLQTQYELQKKILQRMKEFQMTPVLPAFAGHVPALFKYKYPDEHFTQSPNWGGFPDPYGQVTLLDFTSDLFQQIGTSFIEVQTELYDHVTDYYNCDTYNEMDPSTNHSDYLRAASQAVYKPMSTKNPDAVWIMQGWLFINSAGFWNPKNMEAYLGGVPDDKMIILDLYSEQHPAFTRYFNKPFIWNTLHNFGGNHGTKGHLQGIAQNFTKHLDGPLMMKNMVGVGITMEGIWQNYVVYDLTLSLAWDKDVVMSSWVPEYALKRYGYPLSSNIATAWDLLLKNPYSEYSPGGVTKSAMVLRPSMGLDRKGFMGTNFTYDPKALEEAWSHLLAEKRFDSKLYRYDVIDFGRQVLSNRFLESYRSLQQAVKDKNLDEIVKLNGTMLGYMDDQDDLLSCDSNWMVGTWIERALNWGDDPQWLNFNARNQITLWGPTGQIRDYASKQWSGLMKTYHRERWALYFEMLIGSKGSIDGRAFEDRCFQQVELPWQYDQTPFPSKPTKNLQTVACAILSKYTSYSCLEF